eukprot:6189696-Pleurochrysis_carterae.AAC.2
MAPAQNVRNLHSARKPGFLSSVGGLRDQDRQFSVLYTQQHARNGSGELAGATKATTSSKSM